MADTGDRQGGGTEPTALEQLTAMAARGCESGFEAVFAESGDDVFRFCCSLVGAADGEDLVRRVAGRAARALEESGVSTNPGRWLLRLAYEEAAGGGAGAGPAAPEPPRRVPVWKRGEAAAAAVPARAAEAPFAERFESLSETQRGGLALRELGNLPYGAIADVLKIDQATARACVSAARLALQPQLPEPDAMCGPARKLMSDDQRSPAADAALRAHVDACPVCPDAARSMKGLATALDDLLPHIAPALLLAVIKEASAFAAEPPPSSGGPEAVRRSSRRRHGRRALALGGVAALLVVAGALGLSATSLDRPGEARNARASLVPIAAVAQGIAGVSESGGECPSGTVRVRDHCEPACPDGDRAVDGQCGPDPDCPPPRTRLPDGSCVPDDGCRPPRIRLPDGPCVPIDGCPGGEARLPDGSCPPVDGCPGGQARLPDGSCPPVDGCPGGQARRPDGSCPEDGCPGGQAPLPDGSCPDRVVPICRVGHFVNGHCEIDAVCPPRARFRNGRCEYRAVCPPNTIKVRKGICRRRVRCPKGAKLLADGTCLGRVVCPPPTTRHGEVCEPPVKCPDGAKPAGDHCELPAVCPSGTKPVGDRCELPPVCPLDTTPSPQGCIGKIVCPPGTVPQGIRCVRPCNGVLLGPDDPCLDPCDPYRREVIPPPVEPGPVLPPDDYVDRHGDRPGAGHSPGHGRGHDPAHDPGRAADAVTGAEQPASSAWPAAGYPVPQQAAEDESRPASGPSRTSPAGPPGGRPEPAGDGRPGGRGPAGAGQAPPAGDAGRGRGPVRPSETYAPGRGQAGSPPVRGQAGSPPAWGQAGSPPGQAGRSQAGRGQAAPRAGNPRAGQARGGPAHRRRVLPPVALLVVTGIALPPLLARRRRAR
ncbi:MAG TPA: hypothetical protein VF712_07030 [Thermoleophilaceae bacterium]